MRRRLPVIGRNGILSWPTTEFSSELLLPRYHRSQSLARPFHIPRASLNTAKMVLKSGAIFGHPGLQPPTTRPDYATYRSPHGPQMTTQTNFRGVNQRVLTVFGKSAALFGATAAVGALYFASGIPRVRVDILEKVPFIGSFYHHEVAPEDNPF